MESSNEIQSKMNPSILEKKSAESYRFGKVIGEGSFSTVYLAKEIESSKEYASEFREKIVVVLLLIK
jgi:3-phosphoinositide dependent protein kinase-1